MNPNRSDRPPRALLVAALNWAATGRLGLAMCERGISTGVLAPRDHVLHRLDRIAARFQPSAAASGPASCLSAIRTFEPDILVPCDDTALGWLHRLHVEAAAQSGARSARIVGLIEASLGDPASFALAGSKGAVMRLAAELGIAVPPTAHAATIAELRVAIERIGLPAVLKSEGSWGGFGVRVVDTVEDAISAYHELRGAPGLSKRIRDLFGGRGAPPTDRPLSVQRYVKGRPANRAVFCAGGEVLAGLSVEVLQSEFETSPATVVKIIDDPAMNTAAAKLAAALRLNGFAGFDFQIERETGQAMLLEINPRATQICHLARSEASDQIGALARHLEAKPKQACFVPPGIDTVALFPQELWRDPHSPYLRSAYHDVPWEEIALVDLCLHKPVGNWRWRLQKFAAAKMRPKPKPRPMTGFQRAIPDQEPV